MMRWVGSAALAVAATVVPLTGGHGGGWSIQTTRNVSAASALTGVSCPAPDACIAVGNAESVSFTFRTLAEWWDGRTWTLQAMPKPARSGAAGLGDVSCPRAADCFAVGGAGNGTLVEHWDGHSWQIQDSGTGRHGSLGSVSCSGPDACTAVGFTGDAGPTFAERWAHGRWKIQATRIPTQISYLYAVSCSSPSACTATGFYETPKILAAEKVLVERWNGRVWKLQPTPAARLSGVLNGVSCSSASDCTAVGSGGPPRGRQSVLVEHWNGRRWRLQSTPVVKGRSSRNSLA